MRLFISVQLAENMKQSLIGVMHDLKQQGVTGSYVPVRNLHVTLAFIGEVESAEKIRQVMDSIPVEKARLSFSEFGNFGDVFWIGIKGNQKIKKYASDLRRALTDQGIPCDNRKFDPHVTLIRNQKGRRPHDLVLPREEMTISRISLMKSEVKDGKRVYKEIYSVE